MPDDPVMDSCPACDSTSTTAFELGSVTTTKCTSCNAICSVIVAEAL